MQLPKIIVILILTILIGSCAPIDELTNQPSQTEWTTTNITNTVANLPPQGTSTAVNVPGTTSSLEIPTKSVQITNDNLQETNTSGLSITPTLTVPPTMVFTPTPTKIIYPYAKQLGSPVFLQNFAYPDLGCNWFGIAGQVFGENGEIQENIVVEVGGEINGNNIAGMSLTGLAPIYGPGGFEIVLGDKPEASQQSVWIQLHDTDGVQLSKKIYFNTYDNCDKNLILVNFTDLRYINIRSIFFPIINK
ncbi:MAG TPA: hypothetical protein G4N95_08660 [Anaerolineae bacterium]|nr:hypothetical protein [Anaerolineae bacterium]